MSRKPPVYRPISPPLQPDMNVAVRWAQGEFERVSWTLGEMDGAGSGSVTSVDASGGTTGLQFTGGPITSTGTLLLSGTLSANSGGTGVTALSGYIKGDGTHRLYGQVGVPAEDISTPIDGGTFN